MAKEPAFYAFLGDDEYLVERKAAPVFARLRRDVTDEFAIEKIDGRVTTVDEVASVVARVLEAARTDSLFGGGKVVWLHSMAFLGDNRLGQAEGTRQALENLRIFLESLAPGDVSLVLSGSPVDRRKSFAKWILKQPGAQDIASRKKGGDAFSSVVLEEAKALGVTFEGDALEALRGKLNADPRMAVSELNKLATALPEGKNLITVSMVVKEVPEFGESEFFEAAAVFSEGDLVAALEALRRYFFSHKEARPLLANLFNQNRLVLLLKVASEAGWLPSGNLSADSLRAAAANVGEWYGQTGQKNAVNLFAQHPFRLTMLQRVARNTPLRRLLDNQEAMLEAFRDLIRRPNDQLMVMRELFCRCLGQ